MIKPMPKKARFFVFCGVFLLKCFSSYERAFAGVLSQAELTLCRWEGTMIKKRGCCGTVMAGGENRLHGIEEPGADLPAGFHCQNEAGRAGGKRLPCLQRLLSRVPAAAGSLRAASGDDPAAGKSLFRINLLWRLLKNAGASQAKGGRDNG